MKTKLKPIPGSTYIIGRRASFWASTLDSRSDFSSRCCSNACFSSICLWMAHIKWSSNVIGRNTCCKMLNDGKNWYRNVKAYFFIKKYFKWLWTCLDFWIFGCSCDQVIEKHKLSWEFIGTYFDFHLNKKFEKLLF